MKCLILAAGYATRLYPLTENFPKPLLEVKGKTILDWLLDDIDESEKINEYVIISNNKFVKHFEKWSKEKELSAPVTVLNDGSNDNDSRLGAVADIKFAIDSLNIDDDILKDALLNLEEEYRVIIKKRYYDDLTQMEIAKEFNVSQAQISRIEKEAINKLRKYF